MAYNDNEPHDAQGRWIGGGGIAPAGAQRARLRSGLQELKTAHDNYAAKLEAGTITTPELNKLDKINSFVLKNQGVLKTLK